MITYEEIKIWFGDKDNKKNLLFAGCFVVVFAVGFGAGSFIKQNRQKKAKTYTNNSIQSAKKPAVLAETTDENILKVVDKTTASSTSPSICKIKGNISTGGKKIYHVPNGSFYKKVKAEMCFISESDAKAAGFIKSSR